MEVTGATGSKAARAPVSKVRRLDPALPVINADGRVEVGWNGTAYEPSTLGELVAAVLSNAPPDVTPLHAYCATYIRVEMGRGTPVELSAEVVDTLLVYLEHLRKRGWFADPYTVLRWLIRPEDVPAAYRAGLVLLYRDLPAKRAEAAARAARLTAERVAAEAAAKAARQAALQPAAHPQPGA